MRKLFAIVIPMLIISGCSNAQDLKTEQVKNLMSFARLYGYVKYFHPSSEAQKIDWKSFAVYGVKEIIKASTQEQAEKTLQKLFLPIAPSILIYKPGEKDSVINFSSLKPNDTANSKVVYWFHKGDGMDSGTVIGNVYRSILKKNNYDENTYSKDSVKFGDFINDSLPNGMKFKLPIALCYTNELSFPPVDSKILTSLEAGVLKNSGIFSFEDTDCAVANIIIAWNTMEHFFPYFDVVKEVSECEMGRWDYWNGKLNEFINMALNTNTEKEHLELINKFTASLNDGHGWVNYFNEKERCYPSFIVDWIQDSVVITEVTDKSEKDIMPGDVIIQVNGENIYDLVKRKDSLISAATEQYRKKKNMDWELFKRSCGDKMEIVFSRNGNKFTKQIQSNFANPYFSQYKNEDQIRKIKDDIFYIQMNKLSYDEFKNSIESFKNAKGIIFDLRGYPTKFPTPFLGHLSETELKSEKFLVPFVTRPDYQNVVLDTNEWSIPSLYPKLKSKIIFLTNTKAISYAETVMGIVENYKLGEIVGSPTAGTNGNVNTINLLGGIQILFTGMKTLKHDGSRYHGIGVKPTIPFERTIKGIREGRDEVLEKAIEVIEGKQQ